MHSIQNESKIIPNQFIESPIGELLQNYSSKIATMFIEKVLNNISIEDFNEARKWSEWKNSRIKKLSNDLNYSPNRIFIELQLSGIMCAILLKKELKTRYPNHTIEYNKDCNPASTTWNPTRHWLKIDGHNGKEFDDAHNGTPIELSLVSLE